MTVKGSSLGTAATALAKPAGALSSPSTVRAQQSGVGGLALQDRFDRAALPNAVGNLRAPLDSGVSGGAGSLTGPGVPKRGLASSPTEAGGDGQSALTASSSPAAKTSGLMSAPEDVPALPPPGTTVEGSVTIGDVTAQGSVSASPVENGMVTVTISVKGELDLAGPEGAGAPEGESPVEAEASMGGTRTWQYVMTEEQYQAVRDGGALPDPSDPSTMPPGTAVIMTEGTYADANFSATLRRGYLRATGSTSTTLTERTAVAVQNVSVPDADPPTNVMRVTVGPENAIENEARLGVGIGAGPANATAGLEHGTTATDSTLQVVEFDMNTPEGRAAYQHFTETGELPEESGTGFRVGTIEQHSVEDTGALFAELGVSVPGVGGASVGGEAQLWKNGATHRVTTWDDGTVEEQISGGAGNRSMTWERTTYPDGRPPEERFTLGLTDLDAGPTASLTRATGAPNDQVRGDHNVSLTMTGEEAMQLRDQARDYLAWCKENGRTPPEYIEALAQAETPQEVAFVLYARGGVTDRSPDNPAATDSHYEPSHDGVIQALDIMAVETGQPIPGTLEYEPS